VVGLLKLGFGQVPEIGRPDPATRRLDHLGNGTVVLVPKTCRPRRTFPRLSGDVVKGALLCQTIKKDSGEKLSVEIRPQALSGDPRAVPFIDSSLNLELIG
jgi:hypothetical protein